MAVISATQHAIRELLARVLPACSAQTYRRLAQSARHETFGRDDLIFRQGGPIPLTLLLHGHGAYRRRTVDGQVLLVGIADPGAIVGFTSIASAHTSVDLIGLTAGEVALWKGTDIRRLAASDAGLALGAIDRMAASLNTFTEKLDGFLHQNARRRVVRVLARHQEHFFSDPPVLSRSHLPSLVGTSREMTSRVLRQLEREGMVARVGRTGLSLLRPDLLAADALEPSPDPT